MNFDELVENQETAAPAKRGLELRRRPDFVVGGLPTVSLLPREFKAAARDKAIRRVLVGVVVIGLMVAGGCTAGSTLLSSAAQTQLDAANARSQQLIGQLSKFSDIQALQQSIAVGSAAKRVGSSTEIDWQAQIDAIEADMPTDYSVVTVVADSASPVLAYPQGTTPLERPRAATITMTVTAPTITELPVWLRKIRSIAAYADATADASSQEGAGYSVQLLIHLSPKAIETAKAAK